VALDARRSVRFASLEDKAVPLVRSPIRSHPKTSLSLPVLATVLGVAALTVFGGISAQAAEAPIGLGTAESFAILAGPTVTNTGFSTISGSLGVSPGTAVVGFPPGLVSDGTIHAADAVALQAQDDLTTAYVDAAGRSTTQTVGDDLSGMTLVSGVYTGPTLGLTGTVTLNAEGNPDAVFIFQAGSTLITDSNTTVALIGGASACNVFWQVGSSATLGTNSTFVGTVMALTSITADTGATIQGRLLARNAGLTLDDNTVTRPTCPDTTGGSTTTPSSSSTSSPSTSSTSSPTTSSPSPSTSVLGTSTAGGPSASAKAPSSAPVGSGTGSTSAHVLGLTHADTGTGTGTGSLPFTGAQVITPLLVGGSALATGTALLLSTRRRRQAGPTTITHGRRH
jgi:hypothetical protein